MPRKHLLLNWCIALAILALILFCVIRVYARSGSLLHNFSASQSGGLLSVAILSLYAPPS